MPRPYSMAKRAEATDRTRRRIEAALIRLLASRPYNGITIVEIAAEADVAVRTVQRHFRTKDDVLAASARFPEQVVAEEWRRRPAPESAAEDISRLVNGAFAIYEEHSAEVWAAYCRSVEVPELRETLEAGIAARTARIDELLACWPDAWTVETATAKRLVLSLTSFPTWRSFTESGRFSPAKAAAEVTDILCQRLLRPSRS